MARQNTSGYESKSTPFVCREFPYSRLEDTSPTIHNPAAVVGFAAANSTYDWHQLTGTIITLDACNSIAMINIARGAAYYHPVRNVRTYAANAESTFLQLDIGIPVYYDSSTTMPTGTKLSLAPSDQTHYMSPLFGYIWWGEDEIPDGFSANANPYPLGSASVGTTSTDIVILQK